MIASGLVTEAEYLTTLYRPDCDYIDGELQERNLGRRDHSNLQSEILFWFRSRRATLGINAYVEQRVKVAPRRYRIPDVSVATLPERDEQVFTTRPFIVMEVLSPEDSLRRMQQRFDDYLAMGIQNIWVLDPETGRAWVITEQGYLETRDRILRTTDGVIAMPTAEVLVANH